MKEKLNYLQSKNIFIHLGIDHYEDGSNVLFSIEFKDYSVQTGWYNDNHEFGDYGDVMESAIDIAYWFMEDEIRIKTIDGRFDDPIYREINKKVMSYYK